MRTALLGSGGVAAERKPKRRVGGSFGFWGVGFHEVGGRVKIRER